MSVYEEAYSTELKKYVSALEANYEYSKGNIKLGKFQCCDNCKFPLICANLKIDFTERLNTTKHRRPYFTPADRNARHSKNCNIKKRIVLRYDKKYEQSDTFLEEGKEFRVNYDPTNGLVINSSRPSTNSAISFQNNGNMKNSMKKKYNFQSKQVGTTKKHIIQSRNGFKDMVEIFTLYKMGILTDISLYDRNNNPLNFNSFFINTNRASKVSPFKIVDEGKNLFYYGQAYAHSSKKDKKIIILKFSNKVKINGKNIIAQPYTIIFPKLMQKSRRKGLYNELKKYAERFEKNKKVRDSYFTLFFRGSFEIYQGKYLRFNYSNSQLPIEKNIEIIPN